MTSLETKIKSHPIDGVEVVVITLTQTRLEIDITPTDDELKEMFNVIGKYLRQRNFFNCPLND